MFTKGIFFNPELDTVLYLGLRFQHWSLRTLARLNCPLFGNHLVELHLHPDLWGALLRIRECPWWAPSWSTSSSPLGYPSDWPLVHTQSHLHHHSLRPALYPYLYHQPSHLAPAPWLVLNPFLFSYEKNLRKQAFHFIPCQKPISETYDSTEDIWGFPRWPAGSFWDGSCWPLSSSTLPRSLCFSDTESSVEPVCAPGHHTHLGICLPGVAFPTPLFVLLLAFLVVSYWLFKPASR